MAGDIAVCRCGLPSVTCEPHVVRAKARAEKLRLHARHARSGLERAERLLREDEVVLAAARGRHAWGSVRYGDRLMYEYTDEELEANALEELADAVNYLTVLEQRRAGAIEPESRRA